jgi:hypothetical protein
VPAEPVVGLHHDHALAEVAEPDGGVGAGGPATDHRDVPGDDRVGGDAVRADLPAGQCRSEPHPAGGGGARARPDELQHIFPSQTHDVLSSNIRV